MKNKKIQNRCKLLVLFVMLIINMNFMSGCWDYREAENLTHVVGVAIDKGDNDDFILTIEAVNFVPQCNGIVSESIIIETRGATIFEGVRAARNIVSPKLYFGHIEIVIISEEIAKDDILKVLDWFSRDHESRLTISILISKEKTAKEVLAAEGIKAAIHSIEINKIIDDKKKISTVSETKIFQLLEKEFNKGIDTTLPAIGLYINNGIKTYNVVGLAVLKKNKLVGYLNENETKRYLLTIGEISKGIIVMEESSVADFLTYEIIKSKSEIKPEYNGGKMSININIELELVVDEISIKDATVSNDIIGILEKETETYIDKNVNKTISKIRDDYKVDVFGFSNVIRMKMPDVWKEIEPNWDSLYQDINVSVKSKVKIQNSGLTIGTLK